MIELISNFSVV